MQPRRRKILGACSLAPLTALTPFGAAWAQRPAGPSREPYAEILAERLRFGWLGRNDVQEFISTLSSRHDLPRPWLEGLFRNLGAQPRVLALIAPPPPGPDEPPPRRRSWSRYLGQHVDARQIREGREFIARHRDVFEVVEGQSGVPASIIAAIIGVETKFGKFTGSYPTLETLTTLAFESPRRSDFFLKELEALLLMGRKGTVNVKEVKGSFAGALGLPQFMPSSWQQFAVGYIRRDEPDLINSPQDAIASVGNFLKVHGWRPAGPSHSPAKIPQGSQAANFVAQKLEPSYTVAELLAAGIEQRQQQLEFNERVSLIDLPEEDGTVNYWFAAHNFFVITQYNRSFMYAAAVLTLSESLAASG